MTNEPWRDSSNYTSGKRVNCLGCGKRCFKTHWGNWCFKCNVERIEQITNQLETLVGTKENEE